MSEPATKNEKISSKTKSKIIWSQIWSVSQLLVSIALVCTLLMWLIWIPSSNNDETSKANIAKPQLPVEVTGHLSVALVSDSPLGKKLTIETVKPVLVSEPLIQVTGRVVASRRPAGEGKKDYWQFNSGELLDTFAAWEKATTDISFNETQLAQIRELAGAKVSALTRTMERFEKLFRSGSESEKDLAAARTELLQTQIGNRKDIYQAELLVTSAKRDARTLASQLLQSGLDPEMLRSATADMDIVTADVPEALIERVAIGQSCKADFFGVADSSFEGKVTSISPVLSAEQRTLRVLFVLHDPQDRLRPGMFAKIGLGTDPREVLRINASSVIHIGRLDYVLVVKSKEGKENDPSTPSNVPEKLHLYATTVHVSDIFNGSVDILSGLSTGDTIVSNNAILLQPVVVASLKMAKDAIISAAESIISYRIAVGVGQ